MGVVAMAAAVAAVTAGCSTGQTAAGAPPSAASSAPSSAASSAAPSSPASPSDTPSRTPSPTPTPTPKPTPTHSPRPKPVVTTATDGGLPLPNHGLTPGATFAGVTASQVCTPGWSSAHRDVTQSERYSVFASYGIPYSEHSRYELDHLIPLEVGGSNSTANLWPEPQTENDASGPDKDALENRLHALVCNGQLPLATAQQAIAANWVTAWHRYDGSAAANPAPAQATDPSAVVQSYFAAINSRNFAEAWRLGGDNFSSSYDTFVQGFQNTSHDVVQITGVSGQTVQIVLTAYQTDGSVQHFAGAYTVSGGVLVDASISQAGGSAPTSAAPSGGQFVHPGAFCSPHDATGVTDRGTPMICGIASDGAYRWIHQ